MGICAVCEKEFDNSELKQVISKDGIIKVCRGCLNEDMLSLRRPNPNAFDNIYNREPVRPRLSQAAGLRKVEGDKKRISDFGKDSGVLRGEPLRKVANKKFEDAKKLPPNEDLIDNFHWILMRARRFRKISQKKLAEELQESESAIDLAERGVIPQGSDAFVRKLEQYLGVIISKKTLESRRNPLNEDLVRRQLIDKFLGENEFGSELTEAPVKKKKKWWLFGKKKSKEKKETAENNSEEENDKNSFLEPEDE